MLVERIRPTMFEIPLLLATNICNICDKKWHSHMLNPSVFPPFFKAQISSTSIIFSSALIKKQPFYQLFTVTSLKENSFSSVV